MKSNVKLLQITGQSGEFSMDIRRIVTVIDTSEFIGAMRISILREFQDAGLSEEQQTGLLRSLKVRLYNTGLQEYPEDPQVISELYRRLTVPATKEEEALINV